jgi:cell division protein FtsI (penicillin-binding protein 3)
VIEPRRTTQRYVSVKPVSTYTYRYFIVIAILALGMLGLIWRLVDLTLVNRAFLEGQGDARTLRTVTMPAYRGMILDRNGEPLAISTPVDSIWVNPKDFNPSNADLTKLAVLLNLSEADIRKRLAKGHQHEFVYLKRGLDPEIGANIKGLGIPGLYLQREYKRYYPEAEVMAHVLGFTNIDDQGQEGLELAYNQWLQGVPGLKRVLQDRLGHIVADVSIIKTPRPGQNLILSIDRRLQYFAYQALADGIAHYKALSGSVVVLDVTTGEILAMANWPSYNPNNRSAFDDGRYRNRAVTDVFEPGSTIKAFSMASALASGKYAINSTVNTSPGWFMVDNKKIQDDDHKDHGVIDLTTVLKVSSNVGMSKITLSLPPENLWNMLHAVGFGQITDSGFPGERAGSLVNYPIWNPFVLGTLSFGYGLSVTPLQLAQAYAVLAENGLKRPVTFIRLDAPSSGQQVMKPRVAQAILTMLESVLTQGGTAPLAKVPGYRVTGKTGTAHIVGPTGYEKDHYNSIFVGIAPASHPRLVVAVVLHDPQGGQYYGGYTAGPIFARIMGEALRLLNIPPDNLDATQQPIQTENVKPPPGMAD